MNAEEWYKKKYGVSPSKENQVMIDVGDILELQEELIPIKDQQPTKTGDYKITKDGVKFWDCHFDTFYGWRFLLNPELYCWLKPLNK